VIKVLAISDIELGILYSPQIVDRFNDVDLVISCGDLPYYYLEYIISTLDIPLYFVRGNHGRQIEHSVSGAHTAPWGAIDLHCETARHNSGLLLAGVEGSVRYNLGPFQYTQEEMWWNVFSLVPRLMMNKLRYGRYLDIFVTHAPPWKIHDEKDLPHQGIKAFRWLINTFKPSIHLHGHIHVYRQDTVTLTTFNETEVINAYGFREIPLNYPFLKEFMRKKRK
jgi:uncharacterized protein